MDVEDIFLESKSSEESRCEDAYFVSADLAAVLDGTTNKTDFRHSGRTPGRVAVDLLTAALRELDPRSGLEEASGFLTAYIRDWYEKEGLLDDMLHHPEMRCSACMALYNRVRNECWFIGDCQAIIDEEYICYHNSIDSITSNLRSFLIYAALAEGRTEEELRKNDITRDMLLPILQKQASVQNVGLPGPYTYSLLNGFPVMPQHMHTVKIGPKVKTVVLASDGYPFLCTTLEESERRLEKLIADDPLMYKEFKSTKGVMGDNISFDDRVYIRISL